MYKKFNMKRKTNPIGIFYLSMSKTSYPSGNKKKYFFFFLTLIEFNINNKTKQSRCIYALTTIMNKSNDGTLDELVKPIRPTARVNAINYRSDKV